MSRLTITQYSSSQPTNEAGENSYENLTNDPKPASFLKNYLYLALSLIVLTGFGVNISMKYEEHIADTWTVSMNTIPTEDEQKNIENLKPSLEKDRLQSQLKIIENREKKYLKMTKDYYKWLFATIMSFSMSTIIASVCLFYISKEGWKKANNYVITVFTVFSSIALLSGSLRLVFRLEDNAQKNLALLISYINLKSQTLTSVATKTSPIDGKPMELLKIVNHTEQKLSQLNDVSIMLDTNNLPTLQQFSEDSGLKPGN
jgi:hypothetical protein